LGQDFGAPRVQKGLRRGPANDVIDLLNFLRLATGSLIFAGHTFFDAGCTTTVQYDRLTRYN
jgi:hypothetical protein